MQNMITSLAIKDYIAKNDDTNVKNDYITKPNLQRMITLFSQSVDQTKKNMVQSSCINKQKGKIILAIKKRSQSGMNEKQWKELNRRVNENVKSAWTGRKKSLSKRTVEGFLWTLSKEAAWRDIPKRFGKWNSIWHAAKKWEQDGRMDVIISFAMEEKLI